MCNLKLKSKYTNINIIKNNIKNKKYRCILYFIQSGHLFELFNIIIIIIINYF